MRDITTPRHRRQPPLGLLAVGAILCGCSGLDWFGNHDLRAGESCDPASWFVRCEPPLLCCNASSAPDQYTLHCAQPSDCVPGKVGDVCQTDDGCEAALKCQLNSCRCEACPCGVQPDRGHCCPGACDSSGACNPNALPVGDLLFPGCLLMEGYRCSTTATCGFSLTCCHTSSDWDAGPVCVASASECAQVGPGEPCVMDRDCVEPLWCSRLDAVCAECPSCSAQPPRDAGLDSLGDASRDAGAAAQTDAASSDAPVDAGED